MLWTRLIQRLCTLEMQLPVLARSSSVQRSFEGKESSRAVGGARRGGGHALQGRGARGAGASRRPEHQGMPRQHEPASTKAAKRGPERGESCKIWMHETGTRAPTACGRSRVPRPVVGDVPVLRNRHSVDPLPAARLENPLRKTQIEVASDPRAGRTPRIM